MRLKVIVDVDTGIDDATALMMLLSQPDVEVLAVTCVKGNVGLDHVCRNTLRVLKACGRQDVPVFRGSEEFLMDTDTHDEAWHGTDGMGDVTWSKSENVDLSNIQSEHAALGIVRLINQSPGEITLITLAPLTNIALASKLDPTIRSKVKEVIVMGGNIEGRGNKTVSAEYNFYCDPEAAHVCLHGFSVPVYIVSWEVCLDAVIPWHKYDEWISLKTYKAKFLKRITDHWIDNIKSREKFKGLRACDLFCMVAVLDRSAILEEVKVHANIELHGHLTRGQMVVDWSSRTPSNVTVIKKLCADKIFHSVMNMLRE